MGTPQACPVYSVLQQDLFLEYRLSHIYAYNTYACMRLERLTQRPSESRWCVMRGHDRDRRRECVDFSVDDNNMLILVSI